MVVYPWYHYRPPLLSPNSIIDQTQSKLTKWFCIFRSRSFLDHSLSLVLGVVQYCTFRQNSVPTTPILHFRQNCWKKNFFLSTVWNDFSQAKFPIAKMNQSWNIHVTRESWFCLLRFSRFLERRDWNKTGVESDNILYNNILYRNIIVAGVATLDHRQLNIKNSEFYEFSKMRLLHITPWNFLIILLL